MSDYFSAPAQKESRIPELTLSLPVLVLALLFFIIAGAGMTYFALQQTVGIAEPTQPPTETQTSTATLTPTPETPTATLTPLPSPTPFTYIVQSGDTCGVIAPIFNVTINSIIALNGLDQNCTVFVNQALLIPQPTVTPTPLATDTPNPEQLTLTACPSDIYVVQEDETLSLIATIYQVPEEAIMRWNNLSSPFVFVGQRLIIPYCEQVFVRGATVTPSPAPPYPPPALLLPVNGESFDKPNEKIILQWSSVGELRPNESYQIIIIDLTEGQKRKFTAVVPETQFTIPGSLRPPDGTTHIFQWYVVPVAQINVDDLGNPVWLAGGPASEIRYFSWTGIGQ